MPPVVPGADEERDRGDRVLSTAGSFSAFRFRTRFGLYDLLTLGLDGSWLRDLVYVCVCIYIYIYTHTYVNIEGFKAWGRITGPGEPPLRIPAGRVPEC